MVVTRSQTRSVVNHTAQDPVETHREEATPTSLRDRAQPMPCGSGTRGAATATEDSQPEGSMRTVAQQQETSVLPTSSGVGTKPLSRAQLRHSTTNSRTSSVLAQKLAIEAELQRRRVERERELIERDREREQREREREQRERERERELALLQQEADELELRAKLASLESHSDKSRSISSRSISSHKERVKAWVGNQNTHPQPDPHPQVPALNVSIPDAPTACMTAAPAVIQPDPIEQLAKAISSLPDRQKRIQLIPFSGNTSDWLAFKCTYERTKSFFSPAENLARLTSNVRGAAQVAISSILWQAQDPEEIMAALEQNYARPELLIAQEIAGLRNIKISSPEHLNTLANKLRNCVATIKWLKQTEYLSSMELFRTVLFKLSEHTRDRFTDYAATHRPFEPTTTKLELLSRFLIIEAERQLNYNFLVDVSSSSSHSKTQGPSNSKAQGPSVSKAPNFLNVHVTDSKDKTAECTYCKQGAHTIKKCKAFSSLTVEDRWRWVRENRICYRCLKSNPHKWNDCRAKRCGVNNCTRRHHALLHGNAGPDDRNKASTNTPNSPQDASNNIDEPHRAADDVVATTCGVPATDIRGLLKILPVTLEGPRGTTDTFALLDEGSTATLIDGDVATRIGAEVTGRQQLRVTGVGGMSLDTEVCYVNFHIRGRDLPEHYLIEGARSINPLQLSPQTINVGDISKYDHLLDLSHMLAYQSAVPTVLIGASDWYLSLSREMRVGKKNEPVASRTLLGWVLHGAIPTFPRHVDFIHSTTETDLSPQTDDSIEALIKKQYEIDSLGITKRVTRQNNDDARAIDLVESSARRLSTGRFEVGLPWREKATNNVPDSYPQALSRLKSLERQMAKDETFASAYKGFIDGVIQKGYAEECELSSYHESYAKSSTGESIRWYLPHFGIFHPQKRKLRVVHDAAATTRGVSLNNMLLQGPDLLQSLLNILFRFREGPIAFNADIREMFPQIKIRESDRDALRFLWRNGNSKEAVKEYRMSSLIFGAVSSPFIAVFIKNKNAKEFEDKYPAATHAIIYDHYMDDYIGSEFDLDHASRLASEIVTVHKSGGFEMRSWISNVPEALALVPKELHSDSGAADVNLPPDHDVGALGVKWNPFNDTLGFRTGHKFTGSQSQLTKRGLLSSVMSVYDPLGLLMPVVIQGRILIQKLWRDGTDWDSPIPTKYEAECKFWFEQLASAASLRVPRWYVGRSDLCDT
ncbi:hypothetical protein ABMA27_015979 [Loxostege sticticalis]|uniref:Peptidase A2 domain-containing protein n=1 Tax=Loxostege sticticalis TaxID=481309 RepID=A0ABR3I539_LOXSC